MFLSISTATAGVINQLILSGNDYDGIYEFEIFGHDLKMISIFDKNINDLVMKIESCDNYDLAVFNKRKRITVSKSIGRRQFWKEVAKQLSRLSSFDIVIVSYGEEKKTFDQQQLGELKYRRKTQEALKDRSKVQDVKFIQKRKQYCISRLDLGEEGFRNELIKRKLVTPEEYSLFTAQDEDICSAMYKNLKKVEIL